MIHPLADLGAAGIVPNGSSYDADSKLRALHTRTILECSSSGSRDYPQRRGEVVVIVREGAASVGLLIADLMPELRSRWPSLTCPQSNGDDFWEHEWEALYGVESQYSGRDVALDRPWSVKLAANPGG
ncbi:hypothetical protein SELMODRAFT_407198 [Selaginella moellendorffii]|uniref:Uncharacterized protein n=1 Tax=Selaginella moellendorffii TaxID=88036 RepID=D8R483_SELML|nr:hypothetical protein SELMODRAFT_407198 [Selaginella moellendorffii]